VKWLDSLTSFRNWLMLQLLWWMLRVVRACNPALRRPFVHVQSKHDFTVVFWPEHQATPSHLQASLHMSMAKLSTWSSRRWRLLQTLVRPGLTGEGTGDRATQFTSNSPERRQERSNGGESRRGT